MSLPDLFDGSIDAVIFDLDGVITNSADTHFTAWKTLFDGVIDDMADRADPATEFTLDDYHAYVDGRPRFDGVKVFLASRSIELPEGTPGDDPGLDTVGGLGNRKNRLFTEALDRDGVEVYPGTARLIDTLIAAGVVLGCVSSSRNARDVLVRVDMIDRFTDILDGNDAAERGLPGKPAPDTYLDCAQRLGVAVQRAAMVEDAVSGVESGAAAGFAHVIGVDRGAGHQALLDRGATVVVDDLGRLVP